MVSGAQTRARDTQKKMLLSSYCALETSASEFQIVN